MVNGKKVCGIEELRQEMTRLRNENRRIVHCHGVFDLLHVGHIRHLEQAKKLGDVLVVTLTPDRFVNKGAGRPAFSEALRAEVVASLWPASIIVAINKWPTAVEPINDAPARTSSPRAASSATSTTPSATSPRSAKPSTPSAAKSLSPKTSRSALRA